jgi:hypothetical protein
MTEQGLRAPALAHPAAAQLVPGYLLTPFGWAAQSLTAMLAAKPGLLPHLFEIDRPRMHVIALALAHLDGKAMPQFGPVLLRASAREVLERVLGRSPVGIKRVLRRLPLAVLTPQSYRRLVELLDHPETAKVLPHLAESEITDSTIRLLYEVPASLRSVVVAVLGFGHTLDNLPDGLRLLASRGAAPSFDALVADLAGQSQPGQFIARLKHLVAALPLPQAMPPAQIGKARRLDATAEVCALAKRWKNCLADYTGQIDAGAYAIYLWEDATSPAACQVTRHGRLGWFLSEVLGPENVELAPHQLQPICRAFADAGIPQHSVAYPIECILVSDCKIRHGPRTRPQRPNVRRWETAYSVK